MLNHLIKLKKSKNHFYWQMFCEEVCFDDLKFVVVMNDFEMAFHFDSFTAAVNIWRQAKKLDVNAKIMRGKKFIDVLSHVLGRIPEEFSFDKADSDTLKHAARVMEVKHVI